MQKELILKEFENVKNVIELLKASVEKFKPYDSTYSYNPEELEYYDSLSFRFEKSVEIILNFFKGLEIYLYSEASDTLRNRLLVMQKLNLIDNVEFWIEVRMLRNKISHTYETEKLKELYDEIKNRSKTIFTVVEKIEKTYRNSNLIVN